MREPPSDQNSHTLPLDWNRIDTVLLDMDGTLLDLNYDNRVWNDLVPAAYARAANRPPAAAAQDLLAHMRSVRGTIEFYSFEYWIEYTGIDLHAAHRAASHLIAYRPGALAFLAWLRRSGRQAIIATNAHRDSVTIKDEFSEICATVDSVVSSHDFGYPKEHPLFWHYLRELHPYETARALFIDDNQDVLDAAHAARIGHLLCVNLPDSNRPKRSGLRYPCFNDFDEIYTP